jgi:hypothetical protein
MILNNFVAHRKPQTGAFARWFGSKKGFIDFVLQLGGDPGPVIPYFYLNMVLIGLGCGNAYLSGAALHGLLGIDEQIQ